MMVVSTREDELYLVEEADIMINKEIRDKRSSGNTREDSFEV